jgi:hypothetical protein
LVSTVLWVFWGWVGKEWWRVEGEGVEGFRFEGVLGGQCGV